MTDGSDPLHGVIAEVWGRLQCIRQLRIVATSNVPPENPWKGAGDGSVDVQVEGPTIIFTETGSWHIGQASEVRFGNVYRWSSTDDKIRLEHLRHGSCRPVHLFDLMPRDDLWTPRTARLVMVPVLPHRCGDDVYDGVLAVAGEGIVLDWTIRGPQKATEIHVVYS